VHDHHNYLTTGGIKLVTEPAVYTSYLFILPSQLNLFYSKNNWLIVALDTTKSTLLVLCHLAERWVQTFAGATIPLESIL
jgi:hypothetical protein